MTDSHRGPWTGPVPDAVREYADELNEAAKEPDAEPAVVILAAIARGENPPKRALEELKEQI